MSIQTRPSPNCGPRRNGLRPELIVIHYTAMVSADAALERLCDPNTEVSAHYLIDTSGDIVQMVEEADRAWHAGVGEWCGKDDINSRSIGIELDNRGTHPFSALQMDALESLLRDIMDRWGIRSEGVIGHSDMAPGRKSDPGPHFDWARLARCGLAAPGGRLLPDATPTTAEFEKAARRAGYTAQADADTLLAAVRLRHRPFASGPLSADDIAVLTPAALGT